MTAPMTPREAEIRKQLADAPGSFGNPAVVRDLLDEIGRLRALAMAYGLAREAAGPQLGEVYKRPDGGTMEVVEVRRGSWRSCVYLDEAGSKHERAHSPAWTFVRNTERGTR